MSMYIGVWNNIIYVFVEITGTKGRCLLDFDSGSKIEWPTDYFQTFIGSS